MSLYSDINPDNENWTLKNDIELNSKMEQFTQLVKDTFNTFNSQINTLQESIKMFQVDSNICVHTFNEISIKRFVENRMATPTMTAPKEEHKKATNTPGAPTTPGAPEVSNDLITKKIQEALNSAIDLFKLKDVKQDDVIEDKDSAIEGTFMRDTSATVKEILPFVIFTTKFNQSLYCGLADEPKSSLTAENVATLNQLNQNSQAPNQNDYFPQNSDPVVENSNQQDIPVQIPQQPQIPIQSSPNSRMMQSEYKPKIVSPPQNRQTVMPKIAQPKKEESSEIRNSRIFQNSLPQIKPNIFSEEEDEAAFQFMPPQQKEKEMPLPDNKLSFLNMDDKEEKKSSQDQAKEVINSIKKSIILKNNEPKTEQKPFIELKKIEEPKKEEEPKKDNLEKKEDDIMKTAFYLPPSKEEVSAPVQPQKMFDPLNLLGESDIPQPPISSLPFASPVVVPAQKVNNEPSNTSSLFSSKISPKKSAVKKKSLFDDDE